MTGQEQCEVNLRAIALAQRLVAEKREPTPGERGALLAYTGFGSTDVRKHALSADGAPLPALRALGLDPVALDSLRRSVLTSFYTPPALCRALWAILAHLGLGELPAPRVLEPSAGTGRFLDAAPWVGDSSGGLNPGRVLAVELDRCAALVLRALHPGVDARCQSFESLALPPVFDAVVGNVPFGSFRVADPRFPARLCQPIHDYFVCRSVSLLRPGGVAVLITAKSTLDRLDGAARRWLAERADLLAAYRLPQCAFGTTTACADVVVLHRLGPWSEGAVVESGAGARGGAEAGGAWGWRRYWSSIEGTESDWTGLGAVDFIGPGGFPARDEVSRHFIDNPDHALGAWVQDRMARDRPDASIGARPGDPDPADALRALVHRLPAGALLRQDPGEVARAAPRSSAGTGDWAPLDPQGFALTRVLRAVRRLCDSEGAAADGARRALSAAYDAYRARYGTVRAAADKRHPLHAATRERWWPLVAALESSDGAKSAVFRAERSRGGAAGRPENAVDAFYRVLDARGAVRDLQEVADLLTHSST